MKKSGNIVASVLTGLLVGFVIDDIRWERRSEATVLAETRPGRTGVYGIVKCDTLPDLLSSGQDSFDLPCSDFMALQHAAMSGSSDAAITLAEFYGQKQLSPDESLYWYTIAAENGSPSGMDSLGFIMPSRSVATNELSLTRAIFWFNKEMTVSDGDAKKTAEAHLRYIKDKYKQ